MLSLLSLIKQILSQRYGYKDKWTVENILRTSDDVTMDGDKKPVIKRQNVLRKLNAENLLVIERGLLGDMPDRLKPNYVPHFGPVRASSNELVAAKPSGFLTSCLPTIPDSPTEKNFSSDDEKSLSPIKKSFSFRQKLSRISFLKKNKNSDKHKWKSIIEDERDSPAYEEVEDLMDHDHKSNKRFWLFRNREMLDSKKDRSPVYKRSKSFEFLPRALEEDIDERLLKSKKPLKNTNSLLTAFGSGDSMGDAWTSNDSLEYIANDIYYEKDDGIFLKSIKEISPDSSKQSSISTVTSASASSGLAMNIFNRDSVQNLLDEFDRAVELFSENYLSDSEPYTKTNRESLKDKRKSASFSTLPSPKVIQVPKMSEISEDFKTELSKMLSEQRASLPIGPSVSCPVRSARRGSVTDWFVLEEGSTPVSSSPPIEQNKYRRAKAKPKNRVRRMSSTKYTLTKTLVELIQPVNKAAKAKLLDSRHAHSGRNVTPFTAGARAALQPAPDAQLTDALQ